MWYLPEKNLKKVVILKERDVAVQIEGEIKW